MRRLLAYGLLVGLTAVSGAGCGKKTATKPEAGTQRAALSFGPPVAYPSGQNAVGLVPGDFDSDGDIDLAFVNAGPDTTVDGAIILFNRGDGTFDPPVRYGRLYYSHAITSADYNGDGREDLALATYVVPSGVEVLLAPPHAGLPIPVNVPTETYSALTSSDVNRDGNSDLILAGRNGNPSSSDSVEIDISDGAGGFVKSAMYDVGPKGGPLAIAAGDVSGDGNVDICDAVGETNELAILYGYGNGLFQDPIYLFVHRLAWAIRIADLNKDGAGDLIVAHADSSAVGVLLWDGNGSFRSEVTYPTGTGAYSVAAADFDGDGNVDIAAAIAGTNNAAILLGRGDGSLEPAKNFNMGNIPEWIVAADFNGDGRPDMAVLSGTNGITVRLNTSR